jgi:homoserine dehydrogenase
MSALRIGIAGLGTVGAGVLKLLRSHRSLIAARAGRPIEVIAVSSRTRPRSVSLDGIAWHDDALQMARRPDLDVVVELIGGRGGVARRLCEAALGRGRAVVTANKALIAHSGARLARLAERQGAPLRFEAAVAGGIPIVKAFREGLAANRFRRVYGILNGTSNFILSRMSSSGQNFAAVLEDARRLGYAEADPRLDIEGIDAAHKLAILSSLAFNCPIDFASVHVEGIRHVSAVDVAYAEEFGYRIKLLAIAELDPQGLKQRVHPCMVPVEAPIAHVDGVMNAVVVEGDFVGPVVFEGQGAGAGPTASAVVADLIDLAAGRSASTFGVAATKLKATKHVTMRRHVGRYYVRLWVWDRPGVIAAISAVLRDFRISIESLVQRGRAETGAGVPVVLITHEAKESALINALARIKRLKCVVQAPCMIRIEPL